MTPGKFLRALTSFNDIAARVATGICAAFLAIVVLSVDGQVFSRYVLLSPLIWTEEASIFALSWVVLLGTSLGIRNGSHLVCDLLPNELPPVLANGLELFGHLMIAVAAAVFVWYGYEFSVLGLSRFSYSTGWPMVYLYAAMPVAGVLTLLFLIERIADYWTRVDEGETYGK